MTGKRYTIQTGNNNPILRTISEEIQEINEELFHFAQDLIRVMYRNKGV
jgi:peptide deformylase